MPLTPELAAALKVLCTLGLPRYEIASSVVPGMWVIIDRRNHSHLVRDKRGDIVRADSLTEINEILTELLAVKP